MKRPCFDADILKKVIPFTPEQRGSLWKMLREDYTDHGVPWEKGVRALANDMQWHPEAIVQALAGPKGALNPRRQFSALWAREARRRSVLSAARQAISFAGKPAYLRAASKLWELPRYVSVLGHFTAFVGTHLKDAMLIPGEWKSASKTLVDAVKLARRDWRAFHESRRFQMESNPYWARAQKAGLDNSLDRGVIHGLGSGTHAAAAFDYIKEHRTIISEKWASDLPLEEQKIINRFINESTGSWKPRNSPTPAWMEKILFAPRLFPAQLKTAFVHPVQALGYLLKGGARTAGEARAMTFVASRMAKMAAIQTAILGTNYVAGQISRNKDWQPNMTDPSKADWLRIKLGGRIFSISPMFEFLKLPARVTIRAAKSHDPAGQISGDVAQTLLINHLNPAASLLYQSFIGKDQFEHKRLPYPGAVQLAEKAMGTEHPGKMEQQTWTSFAGQRMPMPLASLMREFTEHAKTEGMDQNTIKDWVDFITAPLGTAVGYHSYRPGPEKSRIPKGVSLYR